MQRAARDQTNARDVPGYFLRPRPRPTKKRVDGEGTNDLGVTLSCPLLVLQSVLGYVGRYDLQEVFSPSDMIEY